MTRLTKLTSLKGLCLFTLLLFCISAFGTGRPRIPKTNWENSMGRTAGPGMCIEILPDNILRINFSLGVAVPNIEDYPPLLIEYDWGGYETGTWGPIMNSDLIPADINGTPGYEFHYTVVIDLEPLCPGHPGAPPTPFSYSFNLVTDNGGTGNTNLPYPVLDNPEVFPPEMFHEVTDPDYAPEYAGDKELCCVDLVTNRSDDTSDDFSVTIAEDENEVNIFPNPVTDMLSININTKEENDIQFELIGINGEVIKTVREEKNISGSYLGIISMSDLPKGIYFCKVHLNGEIQTHKVVKM